MSQLTIFDRKELNEMINKEYYSGGYTSYDKNYNYEDNNAEAVVYFVSETTQTNKWVYVMKREDAIKFCSSDKTKGNSRGAEWIYCFTTHIQNWRDNMDNFQRDDGRFNELLQQLEINCIYPKLFQRAD